MTAEAAAGLAADFANLPSWTLDERQLGDTELLLTGAFAPLTGFIGTADAASVEARGTLADGTPWPVPVVLDVPESAVPPDAAKLALLDPEGTLLAILTITERSVVVEERELGRIWRHRTLGYVKDDGNGPRRAVRKGSPRLHRGRVGRADEPGQRGECAGQQQFGVAELAFVKSPGGKVCEVRRQPGCSFSGHIYLRLAPALPLSRGQSPSIREASPRVHGR